MASPVVVDLRKIYRAEDMIRHGFIYSSVGSAVELQEAAPPPRIPLSVNS